MMYLLHIWIRIDEKKNLQQIRFYAEINTNYIAWNTFKICVI